MAHRRFLNAITWRRGGAEQRVQNPLISPLEGQYRPGLRTGTGHFVWSRGYRSNRYCSIRCCNISTERGDMNVALGPLLGLWLELAVRILKSGRSSCMISLSIFLLGFSPLSLSISVMLNAKEATLHPLTCRANWSTVRNHCTPVHSLPFACRNASTTGLWSIWVHFPAGGLPVTVSRPGPLKPPHPSTEADPRGLPGIRIQVV